MDEKIISVNTNRIIKLGKKRERGSYYKCPWGYFVYSFENQKWSFTNQFGRIILII
jgi:hypothetical protein